MSQRRCAQLTAWGSAWLQGSVAFDDVLDAMAAPTAASAAADPDLAAPAPRHMAGQGFEPGTPHPIGAALADWKRAGSTVLRLALPIPGDVRGVVGDTAFRALALTAGQAVYGEQSGLTVLPGRPTPSSAGQELIWHRGPATEQRPDFLSMSDAEHDLTEAIREAASELARRGSTSWVGNVSPKLSDARRAGERLHLPASHPARAVRLIAQAERLSAVLRVVDTDDAIEVDVLGISERRNTLAPLRIAVRRALLAGYNAAAEVDSTRR